MHYGDASAPIDSLAIVDLSSRFAGLTLSSPLVAGACPLTDGVDGARQLEDAGAAALVMCSLFEEEILRPPAPGDLPVTGSGGPDAYLELIRKMKQAVRIPVVASLNGTADLGWSGFGALAEEAGADALELNIYHVSTNLWTSSSTLESHLLDFVRAVRGTVRIPVIAKLYPFFTSLVSFARQLDETGTSGIVLFNRCAQPDIDTETLAVRPEPRLSSSVDLLDRLYWVAMLAGRVELSLAVTGGVHTASDVIKAVLAGADAVQMVSALLVHGPRHVGAVKGGIERWLERRGHESLACVKGRLSLEHVGDAPYPRVGGLSPVQRWGV